MNPRHTISIISMMALILCPGTLRPQVFRTSRDAYLSTSQAETPRTMPVLCGPRRIAVMLIGDSLSFGPFGERLEMLLTKATRNRGVCILASCGSSPENWIDGEPVYMTKCGYRQITPNPREFVFIDFDHGKRPPPMATPKLGRILSNYRPDVIIIQQGTNWMDSFNPRNVGDYRRLGFVIREMVSEIRARSPGSKIVWILPPAASKYSQQVQTQIAAYIRSCAVAFRFQTIDSRKLTGAYINGVTGSDGVHYSAEPANSWADKVFLNLREMEPELLAGRKDG